MKHTITRLQPQRCEMTNCNLPRAFSCAVYANQGPMRDSSTAYEYCEIHGAEWAQRHNLVLPPAICLTPGCWREVTSGSQRCQPCNWVLAHKEG